MPNNEKAEKTVNENVLNVRDVDSETSKLKLKTEATSNDRPKPNSDETEDPKDWHGGG